ncbi:hypothetical protein HMPREF2540_07380 [Enterobacter sp. HMSC055A11]|nr:hypothetical protein HMPREF2540_07380 [Enterobacter sp. HMSC055A11]
MNPIPWLKRLTDLIFNRVDLTYEAIDALYAGVVEVEKYYAGLKRGIIISDSPESYELEQKIIERWRFAAGKVRRIDPYFARICEQKVNLWLNPTGYSKEDVINYEMSLEKVKIRLEEYRKSIEAEPD